MKFKVRDASDYEGKNLFESEIQKIEDLKIIADKNRHFTTNKMLELIVDFEEGLIRVYDSYIE